MDVSVDGDVGPLGEEAEPIRHFDEDLSGRRGCVPAR